MRSLLLLFLSCLIGLVLWAAVVVFGTLEGWGHKSLASPGDTRQFMSAAVAEIEANNHGNVAFVLIEDGKVYDEYYVSKGKPVHADTLFQVASLSKWITALGVMSLVEQGKLDLDKPVSTYLTRWQLPASDFDNNGVTARRLLSHTAGLTDGLGYGGFPPGTDVQPLTDSLTRAADASPRADGRVRVGHAPGSKWEYSGGGYTLLQLLIEEVTHQDFESYMQQTVFKPLGMTSSTFFVDENASNLAEFYDATGNPAIHYRFTALGAASLYTTASDMTRFLQAHLPGPNGEPVGRGVVKPETLNEMRRPHASQYGADIWGLGTVLYVPTDSGEFIVGHDGTNYPAINTTARLNPDTGDGVIVLETGNEMLATTVGGEWSFWQTGKRDLLMVMMVARRAFLVFLSGAAAIVVACTAIGWRFRHGRRNSVSVLQ